MQSVKILVNNTAKSENVRKAIFVFIVAVFYVRISFMLYHQTLDSWWTYDDPHILGGIMFNDPLDFFWRPSVYQQLSVVNFTPMLALSYAVDYSLFGFSAKGFYVHQIILIGLVATGIFLLVRRWRLWAAVWAGLFFLVSSPVAIGSHILMVRHYFEGGLWALMSILLFFSTDRLGWKIWLAALVYLAAMLSKEVYIPLVIAIIFFCPGNVKRRLRKSAPFILALFIYIVWRTLMIQRFGGYGELWKIDSILALIQGVQTLLSLLVPPTTRHPVTAISLMLLTGGLFGYLCFKRQGGTVLAGCVLLAVSAVGTLIPVWGSLEGSDIRFSFRLGIAVTILGSIATGYFLSNAPFLLRGENKRRAFSVVSGIIVFSGLIFLWHENLNHRFSYWPLFNKAALENRYSYFENPSTTLVSGTSSIDFGHLARIRKKLKNEAAPASCSEPFDFRNIAGMRYFQFLPETKMFQDITESFRNKLREFQGEIRECGLFAVNMEFGRGKYNIEIDPQFTKTQYWLLKGDKSNVYQSNKCLPKVSGQLLCSSLPIFLRVLKQTEDGRYILSPEWVVDLKKEYMIRWAMDCEPPLSK